MSIGTFLSKSGLNTYFNLTFGLDSIRETENAGNALYEGVRSDDPNTFQATGTSLGFAAGSAASLGIFGIQGLHGSYAQATNRHWMTGEGASARFYSMEKGKMNLIKGPKGSVFNQTLSDAEASSVMKSGTQGKLLFKNGKIGGFKALKGGWKGPVAFGLAMIGATLLPPLIGGVTGKIMDSAWQESIARRQINYDNRFFDTRQQEMSAYQTLGASMDAYRNKLISTSRIYHSRG